MAHILIVDDEDRIRLILNVMLSSAGHQVYEADGGSAGLTILEDNPVDLVISDMRMDGMSGLDLLAAIRAKNLGCPVVFITAFATMESAVEALRLGAADYLVKPFAEKDVILAVERALGVQRILAENIRLKQDATEHNRHPPGVFVSPPMEKVYNLALKVAVSEATVLLSGESGTGKEVVASLIHQASKHQHDRFVAVNCAAISASILEAELFGYEKGAFTGAHKDKPGKFEFAGNGTLFLDEVGELPLEAQSKLLRVIQEKSVQRVGGNQEIAINCRLLCATNKDLSNLVRQGKFREDLYYRLAVFPIHLPPLRERRQDILPLIRYCIQKIEGKNIEGDLVTPAAQRIVNQYAWPGNIRELFNVVERALIMKGGLTPFSSDDFKYLDSQEVLPAQDSELFRIPAGGFDYDELLRNIVRQSLELTAGNQSSAARLLRVSRARFRTLFNMLLQLPGAEPQVQQTIKIQFKRKSIQPAERPGSNAIEGNK